ncbi:hypothetical protein KIN20_023420 [Parelaphostrongylus tenuis]|uniref:7TM GPCR serpentine receptor class x (Srx) domain-containing protein n=1 Tax=Parelaphostrongylus tenuis TaxID=148309 RepID=A0AAD5MVM3_PARTN|nr:hypothetical protein KIN20_023420 [Parelaphostrongylus tenuis]
MKFHNSNGIRSNVVQRKRHELEVRFFKQTMCQNALFIYLQVSYCVCLLFENKWAIFSAQTISWCLCHGLDGLIIALFHFRLSQVRMRTAPTKRSMVIATLSHKRKNNQAWAH